MLETIKQTNINNNGNYVLLYRLTDGTEYKKCYSQEKLT